MNTPPNQRAYIRIDTVFPVELYVCDEKGEKATAWIQGFTQNIAKGGICLSLNDTWNGLWDKLNASGNVLSLRMCLPFMKTAQMFQARCVWIKKNQLTEFDQYVLGIEFINASQQFVKALHRYAIVKKNLSRLTAIGVLAVFILGLLLFGQYQFLVRENRQLVKDYVGIVSQSASLQASLADKEATVEFITKRRREIQAIVKLLEYELAERKMRQKDIMRNTNPEVFLSDLSEISEEVDLLTLELSNLKKEDIFLSAKEREGKALKEKIADAFGQIEQEKITASKKIIKGMYEWIDNRQNMSTGLVLSYEGDRDLEKVYFTYDQSLAVMVFLAQGKNYQAKVILDFYLEKVKNQQPIFNAYYIDGSVHESVRHAGPSAWIGLAALQYVAATKQSQYLAIAAAVDDFLLFLRDKEGGVKGSPQANWYSTEHNLDAYAFYKMFYTLSKDKEHLSAAQAIKAWISRHAYTQQRPPIKRGKGDSTIATDTYAWSIAAFGPAELLELKMNPEAVIGFAVERCLVQAQFTRREGNVLVAGFDFSAAKHAGRGPVVSGEWTSQMVIAFSIMADYFRDKDPEKTRRYMDQAFFYFNELQKMIITSSSRIGREDPCLVYASKASADTGHGWHTPKGNRTGSLAATAYFLLAYEGYNPLRGEFLNSGIKNYYTQRSVDGVKKAEK